MTAIRVARVLALLLVAAAVLPTRGRAAKPARADCLTIEASAVVIRGVLKREIHLGPPGYGETPARDERDTIVVIVPATPIAVCPDSARGVVPARDLRRLQLLGVPNSTLDAVGRRVTAYGHLETAVWGWHFTPVLLRVDSIPALRRRPQQRATHPVSSGEPVRPT